jgi:hypothetical protein
MDGPYGPLWLTHEYTEQRLVTHTCAKAFSLNPRYTARHCIHKPSRTQDLLEDTSGKYSSALQQFGRFALLITYFYLLNIIRF